MSDFVRDPKFPKMVIPGPTARLRFRAFITADVQNVVTALSDRDARLFYPDIGSKGPHFVQRQHERYQLYGYGMWAMEHLETGEYVGGCGVMAQQLDSGDVVTEVGYHITSAYRRQGLATEAAAACIEHAFAQLNADEVGSLVDPRNVPSIGVASHLHTRERTVSFYGNPKTRFFFTSRTDWRKSKR